MEIEHNLKHEAELTQFKILHERAVLYTSRIWQVPFLYIASTGVTLVKADKSSQVSLIAVTIGFALFGLLVLWIIRNILDRVNLLIQNIATIEENFSLAVTVVPQKPIPYYAITCIGIGINFCILSATIYDQNIWSILMQFLHRLLAST